MAPNTLHANHREGEQCLHSFHPSGNSSLEICPEDDAEVEDSAFESLPLVNLNYRREKNTKKVASSRRRLNRLGAFWKCRHVHCNVRPFSRRAIICRTVKRPFYGLVVILGFLKLVSIIWDGLVYMFPNDLDARLDAWVFPGGRPSVFSHWTTHGVVPVRCHSHNDYWRDVPLHSALHAGCISVEADVWLSKDDLLVGHNPFTLHQDFTLRSLYIKPLLDLLEKHNTRSSQREPSHTDGGPLAGVFANEPSQTLVLLIDFKESGDELWPLVLAQLQPLRERGYLTTFNGTDIIEGPVTVVATGDAPFHLIVANETHRDVFYDAPLDRLTQMAPDIQITPESADASQDRQELSASLEADYDSTNSYYASVNFHKTIGSLSRNRFSQDQLALVRAQIEAAHARGLKVRYWGTPSWPRGLRNHIWHVLIREGVDLLNVDDLREATQQDWRKHRSWFF